MNDSTPRPIQRLVQGLETSDGAGVRLTRIIGAPGLDMLDPFLLFDAFRSDDPEDYIAGFPPHPHRGFETVTYLLAGRMRHRDGAGHAGVLESGSVQWMTAGRGVIHSEMPEQEDGLLYGFQLWVNLPAAQKMAEPRYQEYPAATIPHEQRAGAVVRVIAGTTEQGTTGPVTKVTVDPLYLDVTLDAGALFHERVPDDHAAMLYVIEGALRVGESRVPQEHLAVLGRGDALAARAEGAARFLLIAARPLHEPVARHGPFVMNTQNELVQAFTDYRTGHFAPIPDSVA
jgi:redox-sensitive bicupin YhaK (pirin superfamily)